MHKFEREIDKFIMEELDRHNDNAHFSKEFVSNLTIEVASRAIEFFRSTHSRALACHCECLGMNAENSISVCENGVPPFRNEHYLEAIQKWRLSDEKGNPTI